MSNIVCAYRYRGNVAPSAEVSRPVAVHRNATRNTADGSTERSATIDIFDVIDSYGGWWGISARDVDRALAQVGDVTDLYVRVNSPGGEGTEGVAIANLFRAHPAAVHITVYGLAASAASYIATAGDTVAMAPGAMMMVHDAWNIEIGPADTMRQMADALDAVSDSISSLYALKAGGTAADWRAVMKTEKWYGADAAVAAGLADRVGMDAADIVPVNEDDLADLDAELLELLDASMDAATRPARAARRFDLSMFAHAPAALAPRTQTPAISPVSPSTTPEETDTMSFTDEQLTAMRQQLGVAADADEATIVAALTEALSEQADTGAAAQNSADAHELNVLRRELTTAQNQIRTLTEARATDEATAASRERQRVFDEAFARGAVHPAEHPERLQDEADYDAAPEVMTRVLASRPDNSRFPAKQTGRGASDEASAKDDGWFPQFTAPKVEA